MEIITASTKRFSPSTCCVISILSLPIQPLYSEVWGFATEFNLSFNTITINSSRSDLCKNHELLLSDSRIIISSLLKIFQTTIHPRAIRRRVSTVFNFSFGESFGFLKNLFFQVSKVFPTAIYYLLHSIKTPVFIAIFSVLACRVKLIFLSLRNVFALYLTLCICSALDIYALDYPLERETIVRIISSSCSRQTRLCMDETPHPGLLALHNIHI